MGISTHYFKRNEIVREKIEMDSIISYQTAIIKLKQCNLNEAKLIF